MAGLRSGFAGNLLLLVGSLAFSLLLLGALEGGLRLVGVGSAAAGSRLSWQQIQLPILEPGVRADGTAVYRTRDRRLAYQEIRQQKLPGTLRVVAFGGSATAGLGFSPNVTFARYLERMLRLARPGRPVEVLNLGMVSLASRQVALLVEEVCRHYEPDLLLVYSGNNEFLEIHAEKYFASRASFAIRSRERLMDTNLYRVVNGMIRGSSGRAVPGERRFSREDLRLEERGVVADLVLSEPEIARVVDAYQANLERIVETAQAADVQVVPMTVAANWRWIGREDLPDGWLGELLGLDGRPPDLADRRRAVALLSERLGAAGPRERHEALFRRAVLHESLGDFEAARADYRAALDADPHLRRSLDAMADRVRRVGEQRGVPWVDAIALLSRHAEHGILGFGEFYDHVHPTPRGALLLARELFFELQRRGVLPPGGGAAVEAFVRDELARLERITEDPLALEAWLGIGFEASRIADRNLWKYEEMVEALDARLEREPRDLRALAYRGNARYFRVDGGPGAEADYRAVLALADQPEVRANLERLLAEGRP